MASPRAARAVTVAGIVLAGSFALLGDRADPGLRRVRIRDGGRRPARLVPRAVTPRPGARLAVRDGGSWPGRRLRQAKPQAAGAGLKPYYPRRLTGFSAPRAGDIPIMRDGRRHRRVGRSRPRDRARASPARARAIGLIARGRRGLEAAQREVEAPAGARSSVPADVADAAAVEAAAAAVEQRARPDRRLGQQRDGDRLRAVHRHRRPTSSGARPRSPTSARSGGRCAALRAHACRAIAASIVQVGSALAYRGIPLQAAYCGAKHAIQGFTESLRTELLHDGSNVRVTMVQLPGAEHAAVHLEPRRSCRASRSRCRRSSSPRSPPTRSSGPREHRRREIWSAGRRSRRSRQSVAPALVDRYLARNGYDAQQTDEPLEPERRTTTSSSRSTGDRGAHGPFDDQARDRSLQLVRARRTAALVAPPLGSRAPPRRSRIVGEHATLGRSSMSQLVADYILERLREWGVHRIYGYPGDGINALLGALDRADGDPEFIQVRHEEMAAFMACGHAKFTGEVGVCLRHLRPGRDPPPERPLRREARPRAGASRSSASRSALVARRRLPAGGRPADAVQGRRSRVRARCACTRRRRVTWSTARSASRSPSAPSPRDLPERRRRRPRPRGAAARARHGLLERRLLAAARSCRRRAELAARGRDPERGREGRDPRRPGRARRRRRARRRSPSCSAPASPRRCSARAVLPDDLPFVTGLDRPARHAARATS